ncbi:ribosomal protein S2 [Microthyrium microscopicum]|uniref:Ribosomal protein S2 n=1 Tax=Microthyrium microscopicum TaxID=703497 RepID=A0A6A6U5U9_9PEZI|nr:ribosomal protein S2 [Microthyrium microscopicum]
MITRRCLLRHGRTALQSGSVRSLPERLPSPAYYIQSRSLRTQDIQLNIPAAAVGKSAQELFQDGYVNENVARWLREREIQDTIGTVGASIEPSYQPHRLLTHPSAVEDVTLELLLASQCHLGHATSLWHPGNARYIFGVREGIHIISLEQTAAYLRRAAKIVHSTADRAGIILFVGNRKGQERAVVNAASRAGGYHLFDRWIAGTLTNGARILAKCEKKVVDHMDREILGFEEQLVTVTAMKPDLVVCLNPVENKVLLHECALNDIPTIGIVDTNCNPACVTYPIPANDDSLRSIQVIAGVLGRAGQAGRSERLARAAEGEVLPHEERRLVMPDRYQGEDDEDEDVDVIDMRGDIDIGSVRFAVPQPLTPGARKAKQSGKSEPERQLEEFYDEQQTRQRTEKLVKEGGGDDNFRTLQFSSPEVSQLMKDAGDPSDESKH